MKIVLVHPGHDFSTTIWLRGLLDGLDDLGHEAVQYPLNLLLDFYSLVSQRVPEMEGLGLGPRGVAKLASQPLALDVLRYGPDWVLFITGQYVHHDTLDTLNVVREHTGTQVGFVFTESPYLEKEQQRLAEWADVCTTNDKLSADEHGWSYLPAGYDDSVYYPRQVGDKYASDVFFAGSGYQERVDLLTLVDWDDIDFALFGNWVDLDRSSAVSPLVNYIRGPLFMEGEYNEIAKHYCGTKIALNLHRTSKDFLSGETIAKAHSMNPRCYEAPACGAFMLVDRNRPEVQEVYGDTVAKFEWYHDFPDVLRYWLDPARDGERRDMAEAARQIAKAHTWKARARQLTGILEAV